MEIYNKPDLDVRFEHPGVSFGVYAATLFVDCAGREWLETIHFDFLLNDAAYEQLVWFIVISCVLRCFSGLPNGIENGAIEAASSSPESIAGGKQFQEQVNPFYATTQSDEAGEATTQSRTSFPRFCPSGMWFPPEIAEVEPWRKQTVSRQYHRGLKATAQHCKIFW